MTITLTLAQREWIAAAIARGQFASEEEAARILVARGILALDYDPLDTDDEAEIARIKALLAEAEAEIAAGRGIPLEEMKARIGAYFLQTKA